MRIEHPETVTDEHGHFRKLWKDREVEDIIDRLHYGDPTVGWEGDPALALYLEEDPADPQGRGRWVLIREGAHGRQHVVCRSGPGSDLRLLPAVLVYNDMRRRDVVLDTLAHNERVRAEREKAAAERLDEGVRRIAHGWAKDTNDGALMGATHPTIEKVARRLR